MDEVTVLIGRHSEARKWEAEHPDVAAVHCATRERIEQCHVRDVVRLPSWGPGFEELAKLAESKVKTFVFAESKDELRGDVRDGVWLDEVDVYEEE